MSSYYDDPDWADEYRLRDEEALDAEIRERERVRQCSCGRPMLDRKPCSHGVSTDD